VVLHQLCEHDLDCARPRQPHTRVRAPTFTRLSPNIARTSSAEMLGGRHAQRGASQPALQQQCAQKRAGGPSLSPTPVARRLQSRMEGA
jgi:hypothetical protein